MANKLPWFTHDHDAHEDQFIQDSIDKFGHFGYMAYFVTLELLHKHGVGDRLVMRQSRYASHLRSRVDVVMEWLSFSGRFSKLKWSRSGDDVVIEIKKFRERQSNMKFKTTSTPLQPHIKTTQEREEEREEEKENNVAPLAQKSVVLEPKKLTPQQIVIRYFKEAKGVDADDKVWDRKHFSGRLIKEANILLKAFDGDPIKAGRYLLTVGEEWAHLSDWTMPGVAAKAGRDTRLYGGTEHGREDKQVEPVSISGPRSSRKFTPSGSIVGDALRAIESSAVHAERNGDMGSLDDDFRSDED